jgi:hypothetical protein
MPKSKYEWVKKEAKAVFDTIGFKPSQICIILCKNHPELIPEKNREIPTRSGFYQVLKQWVVKWHDESLMTDAIDRAQTRKELKALETANLEEGKDTWDEKSDSAQWSYNGNANIKNLDDALAFSKVDLSIWEVERHVFNTWTTTLKDTAGEAIQKWNVQVKVWFKKRTTTYTKADIMADFEQILKAVKKPTSRKVFAIGSGEKFAFEVDVFDAHLGKLAWKPETGENYDLKIAKQAYFEVHDDLYNQAKHYPLAEILYPIGNDFFHVDNIYNQTTGGTQQDTDVRWQKSWMQGRQVAIETILKWAEVAPVRVLMIPGNHDFERNFYLGDLLEMYFANHKNVTIDNRPQIRKYWAFGKTGIMHTHGYWGKPADYPITMLSETAKLPEWRGVKFKEVHHGHFHKSKKGEQIIWSDEIQGIMTRCLRSISGTDAWHYMQQYVCNIKGAEGFLYSSEAGLKANFQSSL